MKVDEMRIRSQITSGLTINSVTALKWVCEAIEDICYQHEAAGKHRDETASVAGTSYTITKPLLKLLEISNADVDITNDFSKYELNNDNTITFSEPGTYTIKYISLPDMPSTVNAEIPLPHQFIPCLEYYLAFKIRGRLFGQNDANAVSFYQLYRSGMENANISNWRQRVKRRIPPRR